MKKYIALFIITTLVLLASLICLLVNFGLYPLASMFITIGILIGINKAINNKQRLLKKKVRPSVQETPSKEVDNNFQSEPQEIEEQPIEDDLDEPDIFDDKIEVQTILEKAREEMINNEDPRTEELLARLMTYAQKATKQQTLQSIDQAINIIGKLSCNQINLFTLHFLIYYYAFEIDTFDDLVTQMNKILPEIEYRSDEHSSKHDLETSLALGCVSNLNNSVPYFTDQLLERFPGLFNNGFTKKEFDENLEGMEHFYGFNKVPDILTPCFHDPRKLQVRFINYPKMVGHFNTNQIDGNIYYKIKELMVRSTMQKGPATALMVELIVSKNRWLSSAAINCMALKLSAAGMIIAMANLQRMVANEIDVEISLYVPVFTAKHIEMFLANYV
jgi:hypothetical protein